MNLANRRHRHSAEIVPLSLAVLCLDCESISVSADDECPACGSRSLANLAKLLHGSLADRSRRRRREGDPQLFDATIAIELKEISSGDLGVVIDDLDHITGPRLARGEVSMHYEVKPAAARWLVAKRAA